MKGIVKLREEVRSGLRTLTNAERLRRKRGDRAKKRKAFVSDPYRFKSRGCRNLFEGGPLRPTKRGTPW
ncbi:hypothetical protein DPMN_166638 [Dreissena polymorpha]|uniref:Uncharacterized protein n=1 Tax=Dreissena polymorpha TaxID=45954 RepID=A0A9D4IXK3_DREPO|nr:hypothetical protein DPMN_166638 [Dreissena polymorpha]